MYRSAVTPLLQARRNHVTALMLKNALVNINRPGWQDKFAFMPEEEKTSISLTQKPPPLLQRWPPPFSKSQEVSPEYVSF